MRVIRFQHAGDTHYGQPAGDGTALVIETDPTGGPFTGYRLTDRRMVVERLLAPVVPTDILCIGLNYRDHAAESGGAIPEHPMLFIKASNTLNHPFADIRIPRRSSQIDYEAELAVVIGDEAKDVAPERAVDHVFGYCCANDVSARDWQRDKKLGGGQFARGKSFDGFCPLGPALVTADEVADPNALRVRCELNGRVVQDSSTADMIFDVPTLIASLSSTMTLRPGTVILTGTPAGVGFARTPPLWLKAGDVVAVEIEGLGRLENPVAGP